MNSLAAGVLTVEYPRRPLNRHGLWKSSHEVLSAMVDEWQPRISSASR
jgi:hypothetical protein